MLALNPVRVLKKFGDYLKGASQVFPNHEVNYFTLLTAAERPGAVPVALLFFVVVVISIVIVFMGLRLAVAGVFFFSGGIMGGRVH
jgi:hypothetical protein